MCVCMCIILLNYLFIIGYINIKNNNYSKIHLQTIQTIHSNIKMITLVYVEDWLDSPLLYRQCST